MKINFSFVLLTVLSVFPVLLFAQKDSSSIKLSEVIISAGRVEQKIKHLPASVSILNKDEINRASANSVDDLLKTTAGINIIRPFGMFGGSKVSMRGFGGNEQGRILVLQDGVPINKSDLGGVNWNRINPLSVNKIEVLRGPGSSVYGSNAMGGIINIITQESTDKFLSGKARLSYGTYNTYSAEVDLSGSPLQNKNWNYKVSSFYRKSDGYISQPDSLRDSTHIAAWSEEFALNVSNSYKLNKENKIDLSYNYYNDRRGQGVKIFDKIGNAADHDTHFFRSKYSGNKGNFQWNINLYFQNEHYFRIVEKYKNSYSLYYVNSFRNDLGFIGNITYRTEMNVFSGGFDYKKGLVNGADEYQTSSDIIRNLGDVNCISAFIYDDFEFAKNFFLNVAVHYDYILLSKSEFVLENETESSDFLIPYQFNISGKNWNTFSPKLSVQYIKDRFKTYISYSSGFRTPTLDDLTRTGFIAGGFKIANPDLQAEKINNFELGSSFTRKKWNASVTAYYTLGHDFMYYTETGDLIFGNKPIVIKQNITDVELYGAEASLNIDFNKVFKTFINYTYGKNMIINFEENKDLEGKVLTYSPEQIFNAGIIFKSKIIDFLSSFNYLTEQYLNDANTEIIPEQYLLNLKLIKIFEFGLEASASVQNLLDNRYLIYYDQLSIGRFMTFSLAFQF
ncbi:MAG: TonB-dependent receptor [Bacteroidales bacterium]|nr:TonB-dependent receptor [Bacteroidales bacterium]